MTDHQRLPNMRIFHEMARARASSKDDAQTSVNIEGPARGTYTSYRVTEAAKQEILKAAEEQPKLF